MPENQLKIRPLPDLDLARIAPLSRSEQRVQLRQVRFFRPPLSYRPVRKCFPDIFNMQTPMFGPAEPTDWSVIESKLRRDADHEDELKANIAVAKGLQRYAAANNVTSVAQEFFPMAMSVGQKVTFWLNMILGLDGRPTVPLIDPRLTRTLNSDGRRFAFSMMHERTRAVDPDLEQACLAVIQFGKISDGERAPIIHTDEGISLFGLDELEQMVATTYSLWAEVLEDRADEARRSGMSGPLL